MVQPVEKGKKQRETGSISFVEKGGCTLLSLFYCRLCAYFKMCL